LTLDEYRQFYADEIRIASNTTSEALVRAFATVPRENYLGPPPWHIFSGDKAALAPLGLSGELYTTTANPSDLYHNVLVAIDPERHLNNGQPSALALWIAAMDLKPGDHVYHAGCGVGYYTAILAEVVGSGGSVVAIDIDPDLAGRAKQNLSGYAQVSVFAGDGATFDPGICDAMLINAGVTHPAREWLDRLKEGGRLLLPLTGKGGHNYGSGVMAKFTREKAGFSARIVSFVAIFSFSSLRDPEIEQLLSAALARRDLFKLRSLILDEHAPNETCLVHTARMCLSSKEINA
jgi:protein-L-isoaspartate(D-aspartate) O-methyltransferase